MGVPSEDETTLSVKPIGERPDEESERRIAHLVVLSGANVGKVYRLTGEETIIGRGDDAEVHLLDPGISRHHAEIIRKGDDQYELHDAGSRNGTYANSHRLDSVYNLCDGDKIQLGLVTILRFNYADDFEASYAQKMYAAALRDDLTGAFNRRYFEQRLHSEFSYARRQSKPLALLLMDIDHFKHVNDTHGHLAGDNLLKQITERIGASIRAEDVLARHGGEEFVALCRDTDLRQASVLAERVRHDVAETPYSIGDDLVAVTTSVGVVAIPDPTITSTADMLEAADQALYEAKDRGRNCVIAKRQKG